MRIAFVVAASVLLIGLGGEVRADATGNQLSLQRNELRTEYRKVDRELADVEEEIDEHDENATVTGTATGIWIARNALRDQASKLTARRNELRQRIEAIKREFRQLTSRAEHHYGELPMWWGDLD